MRRGQPGGDARELRALRRVHQRPLGPVLKRHVVLIGLPGAGKSTVGPLVAAALGAPFTDLDAVIERQAGRSIPGIFREAGEEAFRAAEREAMAAVLDGPAGVVAPGGGWAVQQDVLPAVRARALTVWLTVDPRTAHDRLGDAAGRPLLAGNVQERLRALTREREPVYAGAEVSVETAGRTPGEVAEEVVTLARSVGGW